MSATYSANHGATTLDLQLKHNWSNPQMALEYIGDSDPHQEKMANFVQKVNVTPVSATPQASAVPPVPTGPILTRPTIETLPTFESNASTMKMRKSKHDSYMYIHIYKVDYPHSPAAMRRILQTIHKFIAFM